MTSLDASSLSLFLIAAFVLTLTPGPAVLYLGPGLATAFVGSGRK